MDKFYFPIIVAEGLDVNFYMSLASLLRAVECIDVINGEYRAYDAKGNKIILTVADNRVEINVDDKVDLKDELKNLLITFLKAIDFRCIDEKKDLSVLLDQCTRFYIL